MMTINTTLIYTELNEKLSFDNESSLEFLKKLSPQNLTITTFRTLPVEIRAIVPDRVHSFLEFNNSNEFTLFHRDFDLSTTIPQEYNECIWYAIIFYLIKTYQPHILDLAIPFLSTQQKSMFPFKSLNQQISNDNKTHNILVFNEWANYEKIVFNILQILIKNLKK